MAAASLQTEAAQHRAGRNAKRASVACLGCKRSKRKCDISRRPVISEGCSNCREKSEHCVVRFGDDRRRKRQYLEDFDLSTRLTTVEEGSFEHDPDGIHDSAMPSTLSPSENHLATHWPESARSPSFGLDALRQPQQHRTSSFGSTTRPVQPSSPLISYHNNTTRSLRSTIRREAGHHDLGIDHMAPQQNLPPSPFPDSASVPSSAADEVNNIISKVTSREGGLDGQSSDQMAYFGATSIFHLSNSLRANHPFGPEKSYNTDYVLLYDSPKYDSSLEPEPIVSHLLNLFWQWQASHLPVVHRRHFLAHKRLYDTEQPRRRYEFFSPSVLYAIMSYAALISPDRGVRHFCTGTGKVTGDLYHQKAKALLDAEMPQPTILTVQTALLLASRFGAIGQNALGWSYSGLAIRMSAELGLQVDVEKAVTSRLISSEIAEVRRTVFWGCYVQDKLWSAYCGRPSFIMDWNITVKKPEVVVEGTSPGSSDNSEVLVAAVVQNIVLLAGECSRILTELYSQKNGGNQEEMRAEAAAIHGDLLKWHSGLPDMLQWPNDNGSPTSPHVLLMHMQFYFCLLLLHRPFINFGDALNRVQQRSNRNSIDAMSICTLAAENTTKLARDYSVFYDLKRISSPAIHFIFIAATIHLVNYQLTPDTNHQTLFRGCLSCLSEISPSYPIAKMAVGVLQDLLPPTTMAETGHEGSPNAAATVGNVGSVAYGDVELAAHRPSTTWARPPIQLSEGQGQPTLMGRPSWPASRSHPRAMVGNQGSIQTLAHPAPRAAKQHSLPAAAPGGGIDSFDWSACSSPINLPAELDNVNFVGDGFDNSDWTGIDNSFPFIDPTNLMFGGGGVVDNAFSGVDA